MALSDRSTDEVQRLVEVGHVAVLPVDGQRVLDEVVGADAEEVGLLRQPVGDPRRAGRLDHDAHREAPAHRARPRATSSLRQCSSSLRASRSSDSPEMSGNMTRRLPCTLAREQRPQLRPEHVPLRAGSSGSRAAPWPGSAPARGLRNPGILSPPRSSVRMVTGRSPMASPAPRGRRLVVLVLGGRARAGPGRGTRCGTARCPRRRAAAARGSPRGTRCCPSSRTRKPSVVTAGSSRGCERLSLAARRCRRIRLGSASASSGRGLTQHAVPGCRPPRRRLPGR